MAVRIPQYESQVGTPDGRIAGADAQAVRGEGMGSFFNDVSRGLAGLAEQQKENQQNDIRANLAAEEPRAQLAFAQNFDRLKNAWTPESGNIWDEQDKFITDYYSEVDSRFTQPEAKKFIASRTNEFRTRYGLEGYAEQQRLALGGRLTTYDGMYRDVGNVEPLEFARSLATANAAVEADTGLPESAKRKLIEEKSREAAGQVAAVQAQLNPTAVIAITNTLLGVKGSGGSISTERKGAATPEFVAAIDKAAKKHGVPAALLYAIAEQESGFNAKAVGPMTKWGPAKGGFQFIDPTAKAYGIDPFNVDQAADATAKGMAEQIKAGGIDWAIATHFAGPDTGGHGPKTRKYVEEVRDRMRNFGGEVEAAPKEVVLGEDATAFRLLSDVQLLEVNNRAQSELAAQAREQQAKFTSSKAIFEQHLKDIKVAAEGGDVVQIPRDEEMVAYLGPAHAVLAKQELLGYQSMAGDLKRLPGLSNGELEAVSVMPSPTGVDDRENRQRVRDTLAKRASEVLAVRKADPGLAAVQSSQHVSSLYEAWAQAASDHVSAGQGATPEQLGARVAARSAYINASFAQQRAWGIADPKLRKADITGIVQGFSAGMDQDPRGAAGMMAALPQELGSYEAIEQVGKAGGDLAWFAMEGVAAPALLKLKNATALKPDEVAKMLPTGVTKNDVVQQVNAVFAPLMQSFNAVGLDGAGDAGAAQRYQRAGISLATQRLISGESTTAKEAANAAYQSIYLDRGAVKSGVRVPKDLDPDKVATGLRNRLVNLKPEQMYLQAVPIGATGEEAREDILRNVRLRGSWVTNEDGSGAYLMVAGTPAFDAAGKPIWAKFSNVVNEPSPYVAPARPRSSRGVDY